MTNCQNCGKVPLFSCRQGLCKPDLYTIRRRATERMEAHEQGLTDDEFYPRGHRIVIAYIVALTIVTTICGGLVFCHERKVYKNPAKYPSKPSGTTARRATVVGVRG